MEEFYERIDTMLEGLLNKPVLAELYNENDQLIKNLELHKAQLNFEFDEIPKALGMSTIANFLKIQGYESITPHVGEEYDFTATISEKFQTFKIKTDTIYSNTENINIELSAQVNCDYYVHLIPQARMAGFIKLDKLKEMLSQIKSEDNETFLLPFADFQKQFKIVSI